MKGVDGRAALRCWPVEIRLPGSRFRIGGRPAVDWLLKVADEDWLAIVPGMVDGDEIDSLIDEGKIDGRSLVSAGRNAAGVAAGMPWWSACRLVKAALGDVELAGALVIARVDPQLVSFGAYVAAVYRLMVFEQDKKRRASLDADLARVPKGISTEELYDPALAGSQFERAFARQQSNPV